MKALRTLFCITLVLSATSAHAGSKFKIEIIYPDSEEKTYALQGDEFAIPLKNSKWNCVARQGTKDGFGVFCELNGSGQGMVASVACVDNSQTFNSFHIFDKGKKHTKFLLKCNMQ